MLLSAKQLKEVDFLTNRGLEAGKKLLQDLDDFIEKLGTANVDLANNHYFLVSVFVGKHPEISVENLSTYLFMQLKWGLISNMNQKYEKICKFLSFNSENCSLENNVRFAEFLVCQALWRKNSNASLRTEFMESDRRLCDFIKNIPNRTVASKICIQLLYSANKSDNLNINGHSLLLQAINVNHTQIAPDYVMSMIRVLVQIISNSSAAIARYTDYVQLYDSGVFPHLSEKLIPEIYNEIVQYVEVPSTPRHYYFVISNHTDQLLSYLFTQINETNISQLISYLHYLQQKKVKITFLLKLFQTVSERIVASVPSKHAQLFISILFSRVDSCTEEVCHSLLYSFIAHIPERDYLRAVKYMLKVGSSLLQAEQVVQYMKTAGVKALDNNMVDDYREQLIASTILKHTPENQLLKLLDLVKKTQLNQNIYIIGTMTHSVVERIPDTQLLSFLELFLLTRRTSNEALNTQRSQTLDSVVARIAAIQKTELIDYLIRFVVNNDSVTYNPASKILYSYAEEMSVTQFKNMALTILPLFFEDAGGQPSYIQSFKNSNKCVPFEQMVCKSSQERFTLFVGLLVDFAHNIVDTGNTVIFNNKSSLESGTRIGAATTAKISAAAASTYASEEDLEPGLQTAYDQLIESLNSMKNEAGGEDDSGGGGTVRPTAHSTQQTHHYILSGENYSAFCGICCLSSIFCSANVSSYAWESVQNSGRIQETPQSNRKVLNTSGVELLSYLAKHTDNTLPVEYLLPCLELLLVFTPLNNAVNAVTSYVELILTLAGSRTNSNSNSKVDIDAVKSSAVAQLMAKATHSVHSTREAAVSVFSKLTSFYSTTNNNSSIQPIEVMTTLLTAGSYHPGYVVTAHAVKMAPLPSQTASWAVPYGASRLEKSTAQSTGNVEELIVKRDLLSTATPAQIIGVFQALLQRTVYKFEFILLQSQSERNTLQVYQIGFYKGSDGGLFAVNKFNKCVPIIEQNGSNVRGIRRKLYSQLLWRLDVQPFCREFHLHDKPFAHLCEYLYLHNLPIYDLGEVALAVKTLKALERYTPHELKGDVDRAFNYDKEREEKAALSEETLDLFDC